MEGEISIQNLPARKQSCIRSQRLRRIHRHKLEVEHRMVEQNQGQWRLYECAKSLWIDVKEGGSCARELEGRMHDVQ